MELFIGRHNTHHFDVSTPPNWAVLVIIKKHLAAEGEESIEIEDNLLYIPEDQNLLRFV